MIPYFLTNDRRGLLAVVLLSCTGCAAECCHLPDDCVHAFNQTQLGWEIKDICNGCPPGSRGPWLEQDCGDRLGCAASIDSGHGADAYENSVWLDERSKPVPRRCCPPVAVVPPVPYEPPMPPKFLPVPVRSVFTHVNLAAPTIEHGQVEVGYGPELAFPSGD